MKKLLLGMTAGLVAIAALAAGPVLAQSIEDLYHDAVAEADAGEPLLESSAAAFRDGDVEEGCDLMEQGRVHYERAYEDLNQMDAIVNDPASGYNDDDQQKVMDWIGQQKETLDPQAQSMADIYDNQCRPQ